MVLTIPKKNRDWYGVEAIIKTTQFYEGYTFATEWGESEFVEHELKLTKGFQTWLSQMIGYGNWKYLEVADPFEHHWHAYIFAKKGTPVGLKFWFSSKQDAVLTKLAWDNH